MPHRIAFVADPQLVDPHTYPGRPWPLSTLTIQHTDLYLKRAYSRIQRDLDPNSILFLGDLFDGGRDWSTVASESQDERWNSYGETFWQKEYKRFSKIFFRDWRGNPSKVFQPEELVENTRIIASLPGNHDLGFGATIQLPVRDRFNAFFGASNRVDIIGNHTFVSIDSVSLSARDQQGSDAAIYRPTEEFLDGAASLIASTERNHIRYISGADPIHRYSHDVEEVKAGAERRAEVDQTSSVPFPAILLTHVPLYRLPGTPCGPMREKWPPTRPPRGQTEPVYPDERNSLRVDGAGWQYQNAITQPTSRYILEKLEGRIGSAFSGDDHDYCEVLHRAYPSPGRGIREITVKSISWAMGVRLPGIVLASLWHELDQQGKPVARMEGEPEETIQTHLCLLPDQLGIFISYVIMFGMTLIALIARAVYLAFGTNVLPQVDDEEPLLPVFSPGLSSSASSAEREKAERSGYAFNPRLHGNGSASSSASSSNSGMHMAARPRGSGSSPFGISTNMTNPLDAKRGDTYDFGDRIGGSDASRQKIDWTRPRTFSAIFFGSLWAVVRAVFPCYLMLLLW